MTALPPAIQLLTASLDLQLVRLIRGAIAENNVGNARPRVHPGGAPRIAPRPSIEPMPRIESRRVHTPEPTFADRQVIYAKPVHVDATRPVPEAFGPLPAPWQMLLREKVWNRPVASPLGPDAPLQHCPASLNKVGCLIDAFL